MGRTNGVHLCHSCPNVCLLGSSMSNICPNKSKSKICPNCLSETRPKIVHCGHDQDASNFLFVQLMSKRVQNKLCPHSVQMDCPNCVQWCLVHYLSTINMSNRRPGFMPIVQISSNEEHVQVLSEFSCYASLPCPQ